MTSFLAAYKPVKPVKPANTVVGTPKVLNILLLFKTESGKVDKTQMKKCFDKPGVNFPVKLPTNSFAHDQVSNMIYRIAYGIQGQPDESSTKRKYSYQPIFG